MTAPPGTTWGFARVAPDGKHVAFSVVREDPATQIRHYEIWQEGICGGGTTQLVASAASRSFAFDAQGRIVYFATAAAYGHIQLVFRADDGAAQPFLGGCDINYSSSSDAIFVDVSPDGKHALVSDQRDADVIHDITLGGPACGVVWSSSSAVGKDGPIDGANPFAATATRLSPDGKLALRAAEPETAICSLPSSSTRPVDHSNDFRVYDFATKANRRVTAPECQSARDAALTPSGGILARYGSNLHYWGPNGHAEAPRPATHYDNDGGKWLLDVSRDGAWYTENEVVAPFPFP